MKVGRITVANVSVSTQQTILQVVAGTNHQVEILEVGVSFAGTSSTAEPADIDLQRQSDAGTSSANTPAGFNDSDGDSFDTTARDTFTAEPSGSTVLLNQHCHPQTGWTWRPPVPLIVGAGDRLGVRVTAAAAVACNGYIIFRE